MKLKAFLIFYFLFTFIFIQAQGTLVINELDCDTPGIDDTEFVELKSASPNFALDGYVVVFFNGSANGGNTSYLALDLDGYTTDLNGIFLIGSSTVIPFPQYIIPANLIQNGADAVAIYRANADDFPEGTLAYVDDDLEDVLLYGTNDADAVSLIEIFKAFDANIKQINEGNSNNTNSIQRNNDGSYTSTIPTPRKPNDGSGIELNGVLTTFAQTMYDEGAVIEIVISSESAVLEDLPIQFTLSNGTFNTSDYSGATSLIIEKGQTSTSTMITILDDLEDEGDEVMLLKMQNLPNTYLALNNNVKIRIVDNDFRVANFGTPIQPTYGKVLGTQDENYYSSIEGKSGAELRQALQDIIADPNVVRAQTYNDLVDLLSEADQNPENSNQVWLVYLEKGRPKLDFQLTSDNFNTWNREHTWPRSRGGFDSIDGDDTSNGKDIYWPTNADSTRHANSDAHAIRAVDGPENSSRGNQFYGQYRGPVGTKGGFKGDVARGTFYLDVRYNGLDLVKGYPEGEVGKFGDLDTLLAWHRNDPADDFEMNRNNVVFDWQKNRNPFIDHPELVEYLWGDKVGQAWHSTSSFSNPNTANYTFFPNPTYGKICIKDLEGEASVKIYSADGRLLNTINHVTKNSMIDTNLEEGIYLLEIISNGIASTQKLVVRK